MGRTRSIWGTTRQAKRPRAKCHPDREHRGRGLCPECYDQSWGKAHRIKTTYNLDWDEYCQMFRDQEGKCFLCQKKPKKSSDLVIDHNHDSGIIRKLLCPTCNQAVGIYETCKEFLADIIRYVEGRPLERTKKELDNQCLSPPES